MVRLKNLFAVVQQLTKCYFRNQVGRSAAELAYYLLFSLFPVLLFANTATSTFHLSQARFIDLLSALLPPQASALMTEYLSYLQQLDVPFLLYSCLVLTVYAVSRAITSLLCALSQAYCITGRNRFTIAYGILLAILFLVSLICVMVLLMLSDTIFVKLGRYVTIPLLLIRLWNLIRFFFAPLYMLLVMTCLYAAVGYGHYRLRQAFPGAVFAVIFGFTGSWGLRC